MSVKLKTVSLTISMNIISRFVLFTEFLILFCPLVLSASLSIKVDESKKVGSKAIVKLTIKNTFAQKVESARATVFLMDDKGKMVGQATAWVIGGGSDKPGLGPSATTTYSFAIKTEKPVAKTKVIFSRIVLEGGKPANPLKDVEFEK